MIVRLLRLPSRPRARRVAPPREPAEQPGRAAAPSPDPIVAAVAGAAVRMRRPWHLRHRDLFEPALLEFDSLCDAVKASAIRLR